jgi:hypothetical protein
MHLSRLAVVLCQARLDDLAQGISRQDRPQPLNREESDDDVDVIGKAGGDTVTCLHTELAKIGASGVDLSFEDRKAQSARAADNGDPFGIGGKRRVVKFGQILRRIGDRLSVRWRNEPMFFEPFSSPK